MAICCDCYRKVVKWLPYSQFLWRRYGHLALFDVAIIGLIFHKVKSNFDAGYCAGNEEDC